MRVITGTARGVKLAAPEGYDTRPTTERVKESVFSAIQFEIEGRRVLDLFAGSGQLGIEALSRGAVSAVFVDSDKRAVALIRENLKKTRLSDHGSVVQADYLSYLARCREKFDLIFLDPPYAENFLEKALKLIYEFDILTSGGIIIAEHSAGKPLTPELDGYERSREYGFGQAAVTIFRKG